jgi:ATP-grasp domain
MPAPPTVGAPARGMALLDGLEHLSKTVSEIWWTGHSQLLTAACHSTFEIFHHRPPPLSTPPVAHAGRQRVLLAFQPSEELERWAADAQVTLALPSRGVLRAAGDKIELLALAAGAGVQTPAALVVGDADPHEAGELWARAGERPLVAQLACDNLTGAGTRAVDGEQELARCLTEWRGERVKFAERLEGLPLTVSGCVTGEDVLVSSVSHQLVGYPRLTGMWGRHCGNQLVEDDELPPGVGARARGACTAIGRQLRELGFAGMFGLDLLASSEGVVLIEINPRIQGVSSLANWAEVAGGLLPLPCAHVLAFLDATPSASRLAPARLPLSQIVLYARGLTRPDGAPELGRYRLIGGELAQIDGRMELPGLDAQEALVWPFVEPRTAPAPGSKLVVLQFARHVAPITAGRHLEDWTEPWLAATERAFGVSR